MLLAFAESMIRYAVAGTSAPPAAGFPTVIGPVSFGQMRIIFPRQVTATVPFTLILYVMSNASGELTVYFEDAGGADALGTPVTSIVELRFADLMPHRRKPSTRR
jgi:hypothetical protein